MVRGTGIRGEGEHFDSVQHLFQHDSLDTHRFARSIETEVHYPGLGLGKKCRAPSRSRSWGSTLDSLSPLVTSAILIRLTMQVQTFRSYMQERRGFSGDGHQHRSTVTVVLVGVVLWPSTANLNSIQLARSQPVIPGLNLLFLISTMRPFLLLLTAAKLIHAQASPSPNASDLGASQILQNPFPFDFPNMEAAPMALFPMPSCHGVTLEEATIDQLQDAMNNGMLTSVDILNCYLARVSQTNSYCKYACLSTLSDALF